MVKYTLKYDINLYKIPANRLCNLECKFILIVINKGTALISGICLKSVMETIGEDC